MAAVISTLAERQQSKRRIGSRHPAAGALPRAETSHVMASNVQVAMDPKSGLVHVVAMENYSEVVIPLAVQHVRKMIAAHSSSFLPWVTAFLELPCHEPVGFTLSLVAALGFGAKKAGIAMPTSAQLVEPRPMPDIGKPLLVKIDLLPQHEHAVSAMNLRLRRRGAEPCLSGHLRHVLAIS